MNYSQAKNMFETSRKRKLANNTYLEKNDNGSYGIRLHDTQIITFYPEKTVLDSGGWRTVTTKARINDFTALIVSQVQGVWYVSRGYNDQKEVVFADGITYQNGKFSGQGDDSKATQKLRKQARQYAKDYTTALMTGQVPKPSGGDCWYCHMITQEGKTLGESSNNDHILGHFTEKYYVPSLLVHAVELFPISIIAKDAIARLWSGETVDFMQDIISSQIEKSIRRYCYRELKTA